MHLIEIFLPLSDNGGQPFAPSLFRDVEEELLERFGGVTAHARAPAHGLWDDEARSPVADDLVILEVMTDRLDREFWSAFRARMEAEFRQDMILIRAARVEQL